MKRIGPIASAGAVSVLLLLAFLAAATTASAKATLEPIAVDHLQVPAGYSGESEPDWLPDGKHIVAAVSSPELATPQLAVTRLDGSHPRCVTCDLDSSVVPGAPAGAAFGKPVALPDGKRLMVRLGLRPGGGGSATQNFTYGIVECSPSLVDCQTRTLAPIIMPGGGIEQGTQNREGRMSPDGRWFGWTEFTQNGTAMSIGRLTKNGDEYDLEDVKVLNPSGPLGTDSAAWRAQAPYFELKNFTADGKSVLYSSMYDADNFDTWRVDLRTGERTRITKGIDWEEDVSTSPDDGAYLQFSSRGFDRMPIFALMPRPPFIDFALFSWVGRYELNAVNRKCLLEPWLMNSRGERGTYFGQPVDPRPGTGWDNRTLGQWSPDGTKLLMWQARGDDDGTPERPGARMVIADLPARKAKRKNAGNATPTPKWAPDRSSYTGFLANSGTFTVQGKKSGSATVTMQGNAFGGSWSVQYTDYSDDGDSFLNGTESTSQGSILSGITWNAALTLSGKHSGHLNADLVFARGENNSGAQVSGTVSQRLDKRTVSTLPSPTCEPLARPRLRVKASSPRKGNRVRVLVTGKVPVDSAWRPVRHATVRVGGRSATTNQKGTVSMKGGAGRKVSAAAAGFTGAKARVPRPARR
ncbi:MAG: hypothetical protein KDB58_02970 [Solirubrobacterales bacterium]|nr:hypothetical protein [Solirubrobacterales bacterium]MCB8969643.1 hypothetical protein [Thermoleophilales bacterium]MCO5327918.1 hypothetical protein [Solirubrobacterales bacterium]